MRRNLKVIISDDEQLAREGLRDNIPWEQFGFEVAGCASNGEEALRLAIETEADIIFTDIMMPELNGLEFIDRISALDRKILVVIISAYDEFTYAQKALKYDIVFDYLLKPLNLREFKEMLGRLKEAWFKRYCDQSKIAVVNASLEVNKQADSAPISCLTQKCLAFINSNYMDSEFSLKVLAAEMKCSPNYLSMKIKTETGHSMIVILNTVRMEKAKLLLSDPSNRINEICYRIGMQDPRYFSKAFKQYTGYTPSEYRNAM